MQKYKIQEKKVVPVDKEKLKYAWWIYLRNLLGVSTITGAFLFKLADLEREKFPISTLKYEKFRNILFGISKTARKQFFN